MEDEDDDEDSAEKEDPIYDVAVSLFRLRLFRLRDRRRGL